MRKMIVLRPIPVLKDVVLLKAVVVLVLHTVAKDVRAHAMPRASAARMLQMETCYVH
jgi:hypothetical protein